MLKEKSTLILSGTIAILFIFYTVLKSLPYFLGPEVVIYSPKNGSHVGKSTFVITGKATRAKEILISGKTITIDTEGNFSETLVSYYPYTILTIEAVDRHEKRSFQTLTVTP